ncbi:ABC-2 type transport system permease protein [Saccharopolyspora lacisalsi]|uniref:ABC-2 type transport system permease protein n=1 Tax=Halosaccharopolyspora lacisalsi TaxID=1000566 RepID=A0A839E0P4_9PSEU|nr:hypothetical protein [Halosaccharopolyspora lacisalsi]MBA8827324.1 ABC-2 type transport system permease protein [Halosaccharopolyspora lacisalsi]
MTLLAVERIKLFSTRSPWWSMFLALALTIGFAGLMATQASANSPMGVSTTQIGYQFGLMVIMVMAALAVTTEYRFGTIRATFQAAPNRTRVLLAKTAVVAALALVIGEIAAFGSWGVSWVLAPVSDLALATAEQWRLVAGVGLVFMGAAVFSIAVGILLRQSAGAVTLLLIWSMLVEQLIRLVPTFGSDLQEWMPFTAAGRFLTGSNRFTESAPLGPWASLAYFFALAVVLLIIALVTANRRDA